MKPRRPSHPVGKGLSTVGLCLCLAFIGLLLGAPLGAGPSWAATLNEIEAEMRQLEQRLVQIEIKFNDYKKENDMLKADMAKGVGGKELKELLDKVHDDYPLRLQKEAAQIKQRHVQLEQQRQRLLAQTPPATPAEALARNVAEQNNVRHSLNLFMKLEAQALRLAQDYKKAGDRQGYSDWMKKKDDLTARIVKYQQNLRSLEGQEQALRQREGPQADPWKRVKEKMGGAGEELLK